MFLWLKCFLYTFLEVKLTIAINENYIFQKCNRFAAILIPSVKFFASDSITQQKEGAPIEKSVVVILSRVYFHIVVITVFVNLLFQNCCKA